MWAPRELCELLWNLMHARKNNYELNGEIIGRKIDDSYRKLQRRLHNLTCFFWSGVPKSKVSWDFAFSIN